MLLAQWWYFWQLTPSSGPLFIRWINERLTTAGLAGEAMTTAGLLAEILEP